MQNPPPPPSYPPPPPPQMPGGYAPVAVASSGSYGGFWIRVVAYIIDAILLSIVTAIVSVALGVNYSDPNSLTSAAGRSSNGFELVLSFLYFTLLWSYMGASLGQRLLGMRVVDATTGQRISFGKAALRWLGLIISFVVCFIGVIWVAFDARKQGWMDKIAGTVVVRG
jgi:uncharacterized RDD family membrane protein YckC